MVFTHGNIGIYNNTFIYAQDLEIAIMKREPNSAEVGHAFACLFSRICSRQPRALQICQKTMERICMYETINRDTVKYLCELGNISLLQGRSLEDPYTHSHIHVNLMLW